MKKVIAYVHSHWDREWYRDFEEFRLRLIEVADEILNALINNELDYFYFDGQTAALDDYLEIYPEKTEIIKKLVKQKKLRVGPFYCSVDSFLVSGECFIRNLELGIEESKKFLETDFIGYLSDTFGHSACIPMILKACSIDKACLWRGLGNLNADIDWMGLKVTYLIQGYFQDFLSLNCSVEKKAELLKKYLDKIALKSSDTILLPIGADHLAIAKNLNKQIDKLNKIYSDYKIEIATPFEYFSTVKKRQKAAGEFLDNSLNFILPGVYSSRIYLKQANSYSQWILTRIAEPLNAFSHYFFNIKNRQNELNYAYKTLLKNHAHDSIYGCSIDEVHMENMIRYKKVNSVANGIIKRIIRDLSNSEAPVAMINLSGFKYSGMVKIITDKKLPSWMGAVKISSKKGFTDEKLYNINEIPVTEDFKNINEYLVDVKNIESFSLVRLKKDNICNEKFLKTDKKSIENNNIKIEVEKNSINISDKKNNQKYIDFIKITDRADIGDSYNFGALKNDKVIEAKLENYKIKNYNNKRAEICLIYKINIPIVSAKRGRSKKIYSHRIKVNLILNNQSEFIECNMEWENKSKNHILQAEFNLKEKIYSTINEDMFGTVQRKFNPDFNIYENLPDKRGKEVKPNTSVFQRFMLTDEIGLITKGNQEYEIEKNKLKLTLLRATGLISNPENTTRTTPAGPPLQVNGLQCLGKNTADFAITFNKTEKEMFKIADEFYCPYIILNTNIKDKTFLKNDDSLVYGIRTEKGKPIIRKYNVAKKEITKIVI